MAKAIATITGTALAPGVSRNKRLYTKEAIGKMVARASERIAAGKRPIAMYTSHDTADVADVGGVLTSIWQESDGRARFLAEVPDTSAGRTIAALADTSSGTRFLRNVSVFGNWVGGEHAAIGPAGEAVKTGLDFELGRLDFVTSPGVDGADIDSLEAVAAGEGAHGFAIAESAPEALVTAVTEETPARVAESAAVTGQVPAGVREAARAILGPAEVHELDNGLCVTCAAVQESPTLAISKRKSGIAGTGGPYADPGYQADKKQRYQLDTRDHAVSAWRFINKAKNAAKYSAQQLKRVKGRIRAALAKFGVKTSDEAALGWGFTEAFQVTPEVAEYYGDTSRAGSWSVSASNGPVNLNLSSYSMDPADLDVILRAAAGAVCDALKALDPDMDGDVDVPGADSSDTDGDGGHESAPSPLTTETEPAADAGDEGPAPAGTEEQEDAGMATENSTEGGAVQSGLSNEALAKMIAESTATAVTAAFEAREAAKAEAKKAREDADRKAAEEAAAQKQALVGLLESVGIKIPAPGAETAATENTAETVTESVDDRVKREVTEAITEFKQGLIAGGAILPARAGLMVREHAINADDAPDREALQKMTDDELTNYMGGAMAQQADAIRPVGAGA